MISNHSLQKLNNAINRFRKQLWQNVESFTCEENFDTMIKLHLHPSDFRFTSRILKQAESMYKLGTFSKIVLVGTGYEDELPASLKSDKFQIFLIGKKNYNTNLVNKLKLFSLWYFLVYQKFKKEKIGCITVHGLSSLLLGVLLKIKTNSKLVYDAQELETETVGVHGLRKLLALVTEKMLIPFVDEIFVVSESIADHYAKKYKLKNKPPVVFNAPPKTPIKRSNILRETLGIDIESTILLYQGVLQKGRGIELLLKTFVNEDIQNSVVVFMGYGTLVKDIVGVSETSPNVFYHPAVSPDILLEYTSSADIGIALIENVCLSYYYCMPNKLFEYGMAGLPVLVSKMKDLNQYVTENKCGFVVKDLIPSEVASTIREALSQNLKPLIENSHDSASKNSWEQQEQKLEQLYRGLL